MFLKTYFSAKPHHTRVVTGQFSMGTGGDSTHIHSHNVNTYELTKVPENFGHEMSILKRIGIHSFRHCIIPNRVMQGPHGPFDFTETDRQMAILKSLDFRTIILDLLHHNNFYELEGGFLNPQFPEIFVGWVKAVVNRYPWVQAVNLINEPLTNALFSGLDGKWFPFLKGDQYFVRMVINLCKALCLASQWMKENHPQIKIVHIDTCEHHQKADMESTPWVDFLNRRRFVVMDLMFGRVDENHPLYSYLTDQAQGFDLTETERNWFRDNPAQMDVLGANYYPFHEQLWGEELGWERPNPVNPLGFAGVLAGYWEEFQDCFSSVELTETNLRGLMTDRISFLKHMGEQVIQAQLLGIPITTLHAYPYKCTMSWSTECTDLCLSPDGHGIVLHMDDLETDPSCLGKENELTFWVEQLAKGLISPYELPAYRFEQPVRKDLFALANKFMHWKWIELKQEELPVNHLMWFNIWEFDQAETLHQKAARQLSAASF